jgi:hypothetical protein
MWLAASVMFGEGVHVHSLGRPRSHTPRVPPACDETGDGPLRRHDVETLFTTNIVSDPDDASPRQSRLM